MTIWQPVKSEKYDAITAGDMCAMVWHRPRLLAHLDSSSIERYDLREILQKAFDRVTQIQLIARKGKNMYEAAIHVNNLCVNVFTED